ncbi:MAG: N-formylglutamate amidohydrolase [Alphaproteobacteria bacterium]|nr:N-formylglutamate amidohydrolase [Alphaproteobacteria bacterium]
MKPLLSHTIREAASPLILSSPHSGRGYPEDFGFVCPLPVLRQAEDAYVDELIAGGAGAGATILQAEFPRSYVDVNRAEDDLDPAVLAEEWPLPLQPSKNTLQGLGLVRRLCKGGVAMYDAPLPVAEVQKRIDRYYRPYHAALENLLAKQAARFGEVYLIDCHSMPGPARPGGLRRHHDFVIGDRDGTSCDPALTSLVHDLLQDMGYSVALNNPYKGVEILRRYGQPQRGCHALQLEISRCLYMNEQTLEKNENFSQLYRDLTKAFMTLARQMLPLDNQEARAAE